MLSYLISWIFCPCMMYLFIIQAVIAIGLVEYSFYKTKAFDKVDQSVHDQFPAYNRNDRMRWSRPKMYICAALFLFIRFFVAFGFFFAFCCMTIWFTRDVDLSKPTPPHIRERCQYWAHKMCRVFLFAVGFMWMREEEVEYDYSEYLGSNYDKKERPCTLVVNHTSWIDIILFMYCKYFPAFVSKDALKSVPLVRTVAGMLDCLLINRDSSKEQKEKIIDDIVTRQEEIEEGKTKAPLLIFPEGTTTNGLYLTEFKRGAFVSSLPIKPVWVKYRGSYFHPTWETLPFIVHVVFLLSHFYSTLELIYMPIFVPNDYLYNKNKNLAKSKEMIYAETIREIMSKHSGLPKSENSIPEKLKYLEILYKQKKFT